MFTCAVAGSAVLLAVSVSRTKAKMPLLRSIPTIVSATMCGNVAPIVAATTAATSVAEENEP